MLVVAILENGLSLPKGLHGVVMFLVFCRSHHNFGCVTENATAQNPDFKENLFIGLNIKSVRILHFITFFV